MHDCMLWTLAALLLPAAMYLAVTRKRSPLPHPPGPAGWPLLGCLGLPEGHAWKVYCRWSDECGSDVVRFNVLGTNMAILNSLEACTELLDKRSSIYSDRPGNAMTMLKLFVLIALFDCFILIFWLLAPGWDWVMVVLKYGTFWRDTRRALQPLLHPQAIHRFRDIDVRTTHEFLGALLSTPNNLHEHIKHVVGRQGLYATYGVNNHKDTDDIIKTTDHALEAIIAAMTPGRFVVDMVPPLRHLPEWFPGAGFVKQARLWKESTDMMVEVPYAMSRALLAAGKLPDDCAAKHILTEGLPASMSDEYKEEVSRATLASMYSASIDTSVSTLQTFFLAMTLFHDVQITAREHIDQICKGRLPNFADYNALPYVHAVVKEILRWQQVTPLGAVHVSTQDDAYKGYHIPKGTYLLPNAWAIMHNRQVYADPETFNPSRFLRSDKAGGIELDPNVPSPEAVVFGFGRRVCPGRYASYEFLWIAVASTLASLDIFPLRDANGSVKYPKVEYTNGFVSYPKPFLCNIVPRSDEHARLITDTLSARRE